MLDRYQRIGFIGPSSPGFWTSTIEQVQVLQDVGQVLENRFIGLSSPGCWTSTIEQVQILQDVGQVLENRFNRFNFSRMLDRYWRMFNRFKFSRILDRYQKIGLIGSSSPGCWTGIREQVLQVQVLQDVRQILENRFIGSSSPGCWTGTGEYVEQVEVLQDVRQVLENRFNRFKFSRMLDKYYRIDPSSPGCWTGTGEQV